MTIRIGKAPFSGGVEFVGVPLGPAWCTFLRECADKMMICIETGGCTDAVFDPFANTKRQLDWIASGHSKVGGAHVAPGAVANRPGFYKVFGQGSQRSLADGEILFSTDGQVVLDNGYNGCCTAEHGCESMQYPHKLGDLHRNRENS